MTAGILCASSAPAFGAITFGQLDDFQNGTTLGWDEGAASPNPPTNVSSGGPRGQGDRFLQNVSAGGASAGGKMVMFNGDQWAGDYNAAGVTRVDAWLANLGQTPLFMRVAVLSGTSVYASAQAVELAPDGAWRRVTFDLTSAALAKVEGTDTLAAALSHVLSLRLLSAEAGPTHMGDGVAGTLGADDIRALRLPGDANFDGRVDAADWVITRLNLGTAGSWREGDFNFDGRVTALDLLLLRRNLGQSILPVGATDGMGLAALPEPDTAALLLVLGPALLVRRRRPRH